MTYVSPDPQVCVVKVTRQDLVLHFKPIQADINDISLGPCSDFHEGDVLVFFSDSEWKLSSPFFFKNKFHVSCVSGATGDSTDLTYLGDNKWSTTLKYDETVQCDVFMSGGKGAFPKTAATVGHVCTDLSGQNSTCIDKALTGFAGIQLRIITDPPRQHQHPTIYSFIALAVIALVAIGYSCGRSKKQPN